MRKCMLLGAVLAGVLAFPAAASAHTPKAAIDCTGVKASYTSFAPNAGTKTNTVRYKVTVDGNIVKEGTFVLNANGGREGSFTVPLDVADGLPHTVAYYTAWGKNGGTQTVDGNSGGSLTAPLATKTITCGCLDTSAFSALRALIRSASAAFTLGSAATSRSATSSADGGCPADPMVVS